MVAYNLRSGDAYGNLIVTGGFSVISQKIKGGKRDDIILAECICSCGKTAYLDAKSVSWRRLSSCGCGTSKRMAEYNFKHGLFGSRIYRIYHYILQRCYNKRDQAYKNYGGRGIGVCEEWRKDFKYFYTWSLENGYKDGLQIDRINNNGNYEPKNCRWASHKEQQNNKRNNVVITAFGETKTGKAWSEDKRCAVGYHALLIRVKNNWNYEDAITIPPLKSRRYIENQRRKQI